MTGEPLPLSHAQLGIWHALRLGPYRLLLDAEKAYRASPDFAADRAFWHERMAGAHDVPSPGGRIGPPLGPFHRSSAELPAADLLGRGRRCSGRASTSGTSTTASPSASRRRCCTTSPRARWRT